MWSVVVPCVPPPSPTSTSFSLSGSVCTAACSVDQSIKEPVWLLRRCLSVLDVLFRSPSLAPLFQSFFLPLLFTLPACQMELQFKGRTPAGKVTTHRALSKSQPQWLKLCCVCLQHYQSHRNEKPKNNKYEHLLGHRRPWFTLL